MADVKKNAKNSGLPGELAVSEKAKPHERELYVVEGDSAGGTAKNARDAAYQEVLKAKGKPLNALRAPLAKVLSDTSVQNLFISLGADFKSFDPKAEVPTFSTKNLRVAHVILLVDPDPDGGHIAVLYLAAMYRMMPYLFREGRVWCVKAPLSFTAFGALARHSSKVLPP
jgi:DNA gyrase subunit B